MKKIIKICCVFNFNPHYRLPIFRLIDETFDADFYFGRLLNTGIKEFEPSQLKGFKERLDIVKSKYKGFVIYKGVGLVLDKKYTHYIITGESGNLSNWLILLYARLTGKKTIVWSHGLYNEPKGKFRLFSILFFSLPTIILLYNKYNGQYIKGLSKSIAKKVQYINNSLDTEIQSVIYKNMNESNIFKDHFKNNAPTFIYIGRIQKRKKIDQLIQAADILKTKGQDCNLVIVGGKGEEHIEDCLGNVSHRDDIWLYGPCYDEQINAELIYNATACVSPGNVGLTAIHSLSYGTPVITHDNFNEQMPEFEAIEDGITGSFFKQDDIEALASSMMYWATATIEKRAETRLSARKKIESEWSTNYQIMLLKQLIY